MLFAQHSNAGCHHRLKFRLCFFFPPNLAENDPTLVTQCKHHRAVREVNRARGIQRRIQVQESYPRPASLAMQTA